MAIPELTELQSVLLSLEEFDLEDSRPIPLSSPDLKSICTTKSKPTPVQAKAAQSIQAFYKRWKSPAVRESKMDEYFKDALKTIGLVAEGKSLVECWNRLPKGKSVVSMSKESRKVAAASFGASYLLGGTKIFSRIEINSEIDIYWSLAAIGHELKHSCSFEDLAKGNQDIDSEMTELMVSAFRAGTGERSASSKRALKKLKVLRRNAIQSFAVDEMKAHTSQVELFKQMSVLNPSFFCALKDKDFYVKRENALRSGDYPYELLKFYDEVGAYHSDEIYEVNQSGKTRLAPSGRPMIRSDLIVKFNSNGFPVTTP